MNTERYLISVAPNTTLAEVLFSAELTRSLVQDRLDQATELVDTQRRELKRISDKWEEIYDERDRIIARADDSWNVAESYVTKSRRLFYAFCVFLACYVTFFIGSIIQQWL